ncbi:type I secretion system ABC transporter, PrtD family [Rhodoplanes sp. Z2-YC6860]|nr:type I secretion system ABC transporter, PrtD family [Rhodoplanes sp. Z2-YC6860]
MRPVWSAKTKQQNDRTPAAPDPTRTLPIEFWEQVRLLLQPFRDGVGTPAPTSQPGGTPKSELRQALSACRSAFIGVAAFSGLINILMLTGSLFMLEVYDRVLPSRSVPTLVGLIVLASALFGFQALLEITRGRLLVRVGNHLDYVLSPRIFDLIVQLPLRAKPTEAQPIRDIEAVRSFLSSTGPTALFDMPWVPFYLFICFAFHTMIGVTALIGAIILICLTVATDVLSRNAIKGAAQQGAQRNRLAETGRRNAEVLVAMGISDRLLARWRTSTGQYLSLQRRANDVSGGFGATGRVLRMMLQSGVLAMGAYLVIQGEATAGIIIASSILTGRALAPVDLSIANWKGFVNARQSWRRLEQLLKNLPPQPKKLQLPAPTQALTVETLMVAPPGAQKTSVQEVSFTLRAGNALGVIGPSASGKSSMARALVGVWRPMRGAVRLDGASLDQWSAGALGQHIGYLPQGVELIEGSIAENIARFDPDASPEAIVAAAKAAGVHDMIVGLPSGYETPIGEQGTNLSAGQQQRVALARALYGDPFLVVLDEPNSNLDSEGEEALTKAILGVRARGGIVIVIAHRPSALAAVDLVLVMARGTQQAFGPKDDVLSKVLRREQAAVPAPLKMAQGG